MGKTWFSLLLTFRGLTNFVETLESNIARFKVDAMNLRAGPGSQYCKVRELQSGAAKPLQVTHHEGIWRRIVFERESYWIHSGLLAKY